MKESKQFLIIQDTIHELGNIGIGAAATSLFSLIHKPIETTTSKLEHLDCSYMLNQSQVQDQVVGILFPFDKELQGFGLFILEEEFIRDVLNELCNENIDFYHMSQDSMAMLQEVCSIMISSYLASLTMTTKLSARIQLPAISMDMKGAIMNNGLSFVLQKNEKSYWLDHEFKIENSHSMNHLLFMLTNDCIMNVINALEV